MVSEKWRRILEAFIHYSLCNICVSFSFFRGGMLQISVRSSGEEWNWQTHLRNGVTYTGDWCSDKVCMCSVCTHSCPVTAVTKGWRGLGTLQHPSGAAYEWEFKDNMYHGHFQMNRRDLVDSQGAVWKGEFHGTGGTRP
uniref:Uncharacterized protein n=1 Tax=Salarias fasciatus TaxID=181472 RepID=A0A672HHH5_SALFA